MKFKLRFTYFIVYILFTGPLIGQSSQSEEAIQQFEKGKYAESLSVFKRMITMFPKDPRYQYYAGVCMVQMNGDLKKALEYLKFASNLTVPRDVYYFMGKAYCYLYMFDDGLEAFLKFQQFAEKSDKDRWQCDMNINMARNGKQIIQKQIILNTLHVDSVNIDNIYTYYNNIMKAGKFVEKQEKGFSLLENKVSSTWRFVPNDLDKSEPIFETTLTGFNHKNKDIAVTHHISENEWSKLENIGTIVNSLYDEDYPYFNPSESTLYFSSKGHNSMGGYDIFKSIYNPDTKAWSEPINLGYPINSPYDDFMFVPSEDQTKAFFVSNRETHNQQVMIYTVSFSRSYSFELVNRTSELISRSHLRPSILVPEKKTYQHSTVKRPIYVEPVLNVKPTVSPQPYPDELLNHSEYNRMLDNAMRYQLQSDSMGRISESLKQKENKSNDAVEKEKLKKDIYLLDTRSKAAQQKADAYYEKARAYEKLATGNKPAHETDTSTNQNLVKNAFTSKNKEVPKPTSNKENNKATFLPKSITIAEFNILQDSPYGTANEIPLNQPLPSGLIYRIQLGAFSKPVAPDRFKGIVPVSGELLQNGVTKYYAGLFNRNADAEKALNKIREIGFKDAFIISFYNGQSITSNRAKELEKDNP